MSGDQRTAPPFNFDQEAWVESSSSPRLPAAEEPQEKVVVGRVVEYDDSNSSVVTVAGEVQLDPEDLAQKRRALAADIDV